MRTSSIRVWLLSLIVTLSCASTPVTVWAQALGGAGTIQGMIADPSGGAMQAVQVRISNPVTGFSRIATTDASGRYLFGNLPPNTYHLVVEAQGFEPAERQVEVRSGVPITIDLTLSLAGATATVDVVGRPGALVERDPSAHTDVDQSLIARMPVETSSSGLNQIVTMASPGVVSDSNGFFHPVGDHAQTQFSIDNQPITDQQSRLYSNQISQDAVQSMEVITGVVPAEYGDKSSLVVHIVTKSGLDQSKPTGSASVGYGSFSSPTADLTLGMGSHEMGNFISVSGLRTDRFLDPPELEAIHDTGHQASLFDRFDVRTSATGTLHVNAQVAASGFAVPNTFDQIPAQQHQDVGTFNIAPGYSRVIGTKVLLTANGFVRRDHVTYAPSPDPLDDSPATISQDRALLNMGGKADLSMALGRHNVKIGASVGATRLHEQFTFGVTDPSAPAFAGGDGAFDPALAPYDVTSGGAPLVYDQAFTVKEQAAYAQDDISVGNATINAGLRLDHYDGLSGATLLQPRLGVSYAFPASNTVLRASYGRTMETPYNENLLLSAGYGLNGLFGDGRAVPPGRRHQVELGIQQALGRWLVADVGYFNKHTVNGYDFGVLFDTPLAFPVAWDHSRINGFTGRLNVLEHGGFSAFVVMAHTNAIYSPPGVGGILLEQPDGDFRIDHDQKLNATTNLQYTFEKRLGAWAAVSWRYDSGLVAGSVGSLEDALALTGDQQAAIGFFCGGQFAARDVPLTTASCTSANFGATRIRIPAEGTEDDVTNPPRIAPRHLLDLGIGADNLLHAERTRLRLRFSVINLTNRDALYNFLSTFSGTHFVTPRAYRLEAAVTF